MQQPPDQALTIKLNSTGERLTMWRTLDSQGGQELQMTGCLPGRQQGPPLHVHFTEDESTEVVAGALSVSSDGREFVVDTNDVAFFPKGSVHRWWNDGEEDLVFRGVAAPAVDLDRYLQALFEVINSAQSKNPSVFYMAHLVYRHRKTQLALEVPRLIQQILFPIVICAGTLLGKYRGTHWPGCPLRCTGAAFIPQEND